MRATVAHHPSAPSHACRRGSCAEGRPAEWCRRRTPPPGERLQRGSVQGGAASRETNPSRDSVTSKPRGLLEVRRRPWKTTLGTRIPAGSGVDIAVLPGVVGLPSGRSRSGEDGCTVSDVIQPAAMAQAHHAAPAAAPLVGAFRPVAGRSPPVRKVPGCRRGPGVAEFSIARPSGQKRGSPRWS